MCYFRSYRRTLAHHPELQMSSQWRKVGDCSGDRTAFCSGTCEIIANVIIRNETFMTSAYHIWTLRGGMSSSTANAWRSSVEGNAVRWYVSFRTFSCAASALLRFFLIIGSSVGAAATASERYPVDCWVSEEREYGCVSLPRDTPTRPADDCGPICICKG